MGSQSSCWDPLSALIFTTDRSSKTANIPKRGWKGAVKVSWTWYFSSQLLLGCSPHNFFKVLLLLNILLPEEGKGDLFSEGCSVPWGDTRALRLAHSSSHGICCHPLPMASDLCPREIPKGGYVQEEETKTKNCIWKPWHHNGEQRVPSNDQINGSTDS